MKLVFLVMSILTPGERETLKLDDPLPLLLKVNPEISALSAEVSAYENIPYYKSSLPNPVVSGKVKNESSVGIMVKQKIPFPLKLLRKRFAWKFIAKSKKYKYERVKLGVIRRFKEDFYDFWFLNEKIRILEDTLSLMRDLRDTALSLYRAGSVPQENVLRLQVEILKIEEGIRDAKIKMEEERWKIASALSKTEEGISGVPEVDEDIREDIDEFHLLKITFQKNPLIKEKEMLVKAQDEFLKEAKVDYIPDFFVSGGWERQSGFENVWEARVSIDLPMYFWQKERRRVKEMEMRKLSFEKLLEDTKERVVSRFKAIVFSYRTNLQVLNLYRNSIIPEVEFAFESALSLYRAGRGGFINTVENLLTLLKYRISERSRLRKLLKDKARLEEITGMGVSLWKEVE